MVNVQVFGSVGARRTEVRAGARRLFPVVPESGEARPTGFEFMLAGIGHDTSDALVEACALSGWPLENVYVELALHGSPPWQAIGRRIWIDGDLEQTQIEKLMQVAEHLPIVQALRPLVHLRSKIAVFPRPDRH